MQVKNVMTTGLFLAHPDTPVTEAQAMMRREHIHRLPVVDRHTKRLVGIVTEKDLLYAAPSPATTLNVYEMNDLLSKLKVSAVMTRDVITVRPDDLVEHAARIMVDDDIGGLPVMDNDGFVIGIVTESDIFKLFIDLFGTRESGIRATLRVPDEPGKLAKLSADIVSHGGNIISIGTWPGNNPTNVVVVIKVRDMTREQFISSVEADTQEVLDLRET